MSSEQSIKVLYELPLMASSPNDGVSFWDVVRFDYPRDHVWYRGAIRFKGIAAKRERNEHCTTELNEESYHKLIEVENSDWVKEVRADNDGRWGDLGWQMHHYMIYVEDDAALEVIADSWELLPEEKGQWPRITERTGIDGS
jgi:hypothetical protein